MNTIVRVLKTLLCGTSMRRKSLGKIMLPLLLAPSIALAAATSDQQPQAQRAPATANTQQLAITPGMCVFFPMLPPCPTGLIPTDLVPVTGFQNPGALEGFKFAPHNLGTSRPLVVALHGCTQGVAQYFEPTGWKQLAEKFQFALLLPQQTVANNQFKCFNWFQSDDNKRDKGEALSIKNMVDKVRADLNIDPSQIYVTGLSAGGGMTAVMLATYPEIFAGGGIIAGIPYGCANTGNEATSQCGVTLLPMQTVPVKQKTPKEWGDLVRQANPGFTARYPRVSIWHGTGDKVVNPDAEIELIDQWTDLLNVGQSPQIDETLKANIRHQVFKDSSGQALIEAFSIPGGVHATPIDPGPGAEQCGTLNHDNYVQPENICSSLSLTKFWGIDKP